MMKGRIQNETKRSSHPFRGNASIRGKDLYGSYKKPVSHGLNTTHVC